MAFSVIQTGTTLKFLNTDGELTSLTLPTDVTLRSDVPPRWLAYDRQVILVNTPSLPIMIDGTGTVRLLAPRTPTLGATLTNANGGSLSGTYFVKYTYVVADAQGNVVAESDFSPVSNTVTITTDYLKVTNLGISPDDVTGRRIYRTTTDGSVLFQWIDLDGNVLTEVQDDLADAGLSLFAAPTLGSPPHLTHIAEFRGRIFGVGSDNVDRLRYTEAGLRYSWPSDNFIAIQPVGSDGTGITALIPRRDSLGVARLNSLWQIVGSGELINDIPDLEPVRLSEQLGCVSQESVAVYRDTAYFLWYDGVYEWNSEGVRCISDGVEGRGNVRSWFTTDDYFNRAKFPNAFATLDSVNLKYRLFLHAAGSTTERQWIEYDLATRTWWGPHETNAFTPRSAFAISDPSETSALLPVIGASEGDIMQEVDERIDGDNEAIHFHVIGKAHHAGEPDIEKYFGELSVHGKKQSAGTLTVTATVGDLEDEGDGATIVSEMEHDLRKSRERLPRVGQGKHAQLTFENNELDQDVELYGYEINPVHAVGRR